MLFLNWLSSDVYSAQEKERITHIGNANVVKSGETFAKVSIKDVRTNSQQHFVQC